MYVHVHGGLGRAVSEVGRHGLDGRTLADRRGGKAVAHAMSRDPAPEDPRACFYDFVAHVGRAVRLAVTERL